MATNNNNIITALQIEAAETKKDLANVAGVAYSGGEMNQWWSMVPLVIDLQGMEIAPQIPLLLSHENHPLTRLGVVKARVEDGMLYIEGGIDTSTENGKAVVEQGKKFDWQLSIGADILTSERMMDEEERTINGKSFKGGHLVVKKARLREVSVVAVGADMETHMQIAASFNATVHPKTKGVEKAKKNHRQSGGKSCDRRRSRRQRCRHSCRGGKGRERGRRSRAHCGNEPHRSDQGSGRRISRNPRTRDRGWLGRTENQRRDRSRQKDR
jgi:hypothetical protein